MHSKKSSPVTGVMVGRAMSASATMMCRMHQLCAISCVFGVLLLSCESDCDVIEASSSMLACEVVCANCVVNSAKLEEPV